VSFYIFDVLGPKVIGEFRPDRHDFHRGHAGQQCFRSFGSNASGLHSALSISLFLRQNEQFPDQGRSDATPVILDFGDNGMFVLV